MLTNIKNRNNWLQVLCVIFVVQINLGLAEKWVMKGR